LKEKKKKTQKALRIELKTNKGVSAKVDVDGATNLVDLSTYQSIDSNCNRATVRRRNAELQVAVLKNGKEWNIINNKRFLNYGRHGKRLEDAFPPLEVIFGYK